MTGTLATYALDIAEPFRYAFFVRGLVVATLAGAACGLIGVFVVLRGMSYIGHGLSHAVFGGAAAAAVMGVNFYIGAGLWGVLACLLIALLGRRGAVGADAAIGVVTTASFALGLALQNRFGTASRSIDAVLFGNVLGVFTRDIVAVVVVGLVSSAAVIGLYRQLLFSTFDPDVAGASGINVAAMEAVLMLMLSVTILVTVRVVGVLLISAMLVLPPSAARLCTNSFARMLWLSPLLGAGIGLVGMYASWYADVSSGATIVLAGALVFAVAFLTAGARRRQRAASLERGAHFA